LTSDSQLKMLNCKDHSMKSLQ